MKRRALLSTVAGGLAASAGCLGTLSTGSEEPPNRTGTDEPPTKTTVDDDRSDHDRDTFADVDCPSFVENVDRTNCYRGIDRTKAAVFVQPSTYTFEDFAENGTVETMEFTLKNAGERPFQFNPHNWAVHVYDDGWEKVAPDAYVEPLTTLEPGEVTTYSLATEPHPSQSDDIHQITAELTSGHTHAFRLYGTLDPEGEATRIECVSVFDYLKAVP